MTTHTFLDASPANDVPIAGPTVAARRTTFRRLLIYYCACRAGGPWTLVIGGGFHLPVSASDFGEKTKIVTLRVDESRMPSLHVQSATGSGYAAQDIDLARASQEDNCGVATDRQ